MAKDKDLSSYIKPQWGWRALLVIISMSIVLILISIDLEIDIYKLFFSSGPHIIDLAKRLFPPDLSNFMELVQAMLETIEIAILGTVLAILLSIPLGVLSARNIVSSKIYYVARTVIVLFRAIPEFILAMFLVVAVGFGAISGVFALGLHTMGFLAKFYAEEMEQVAKGPIEALAAIGSNKPQIVMFAIVPQVLPAFVAYNLYILDRNVRMATMLGIVGAGGIGYELISSFRMFRYPRVTTIILVIFITILLIDFSSGWIRKKLIR